MKRRLIYKVFAMGLAASVLLQNYLAFSKTFATETETAAYGYDAEDPERFHYSTSAQNRKNTKGIAGNSDGLVHNPLYENRVRYDGIDVSKFQGTIDWNAVAQDGIDFSIIRLGYRGYGTTGNIVTDPTYITNIEGAKAAGIDVGVYFFTQAITVEEAIEEANFVIANLGTYELDLPVYIDIEEITYDVGRMDSANLNNEQRTAICDAFCDTIEAAGYEAGIYANKYWYTTLLNTAELEAEHHIWLAHYTEETDYTGSYGMWQYSSSGEVAGITGNVDRDVLYSNEVSYPDDEYVISELGQTVELPMYGSGNITYTSSNHNIASVNVYGHVTSHAYGTTVVTATSDNGTSDSITIHVYKELTGYMQYNTMHLGKVGTTANLSTGYVDVNNPVVWATSDQNVATVDSTGVVTAVGEGTAQVIAADNSGSYVACTITVSEIAEGIAVGDCNFDGLVNAMDAATILSVSASSGSDSSVYYCEDYRTIFDVNQDGLVDALDAVSILNRSSSSGVTLN